MKFRYQDKVTLCLGNLPEYAQDACRFYRTQYGEVIQVCKRDSGYEYLVRFEPLAAPSLWVEEKNLLAHRE